MTKAEDSGHLPASTATLAEIAEVLSRPKFARFLSNETRVDFLKKYRAAVRIVPVTRSIRACRDPRDDKFLEVAVDGRADLIISGDADLLELDPFQGVRIVTPRAFLAYSVELDSQGTDV
jgi:putative PIN family toxin of toxin-antitoxin system